MRAVRLHMPRRRMRQVFLALAIATIAGSLAYAFAHSTYGRQLETRTIDHRFDARGHRDVPSDIVVLSMDNATDLSEEVNQRFIPQFARAQHARVITALHAAGAAAITFDVQFLANSEDPKGDLALVEAARDAAPVVFATGPETSASDEELLMPFDGMELPGATGANALAESGGIVGIALTTPSEDGVHRWITPRGDFYVNGMRMQLPSLSLATLAAAGYDGNHTAVPGVPAAHLPGVLYLGQPSEEGQPQPHTGMMLNYYGPSAKNASRCGGRGAADCEARRFEYRPYHEVLAAGADLSWAKDKLIIVGATSKVLQDIHATPYGQMPGPEIHATALANLRDGSWLTEQTARSATFAALAAILGVWVLMTFLPLAVGMPLVVIGAAGYVQYVQSRFDDGHVVALVPVLLPGIAAFVGVLSYLALQSYAERKRVTGLFARYVSPDVVRELVDVSEELVVGGQRREVTVLFSDIRGFTTMSEHVDPADLVRQLNDYFEEMVEAVELERGTLDKFIGDGMMAIFGAPLEQPDHADRACAAALDMVERLRDLNERRRQEGLGQLAIGIGLNSGEAIVGNIGSPARRVDFTAIGDVVNLASRMESSTKEFGVEILVSESTAELAEEHAFVPRGQVVVKGRTQATSVFELVSEEEGQHERPAPAVAGSADEPAAATEEHAA